MAKNKVTEKPAATAEQIRFNRLEVTKAKIERCIAVADLLCFADKLAEAGVEEKTLSALPWMLWEMLGDLDQHVGEQP
jgi:hypothetical protein